MSVSVLSAPYIPTPQYIYLPTNWNSAWLSALSTTGTRMASVVGIGDSIMAGQQSTDIMVDSWWSVMRSALLSKYGIPLAGDYYGMLYTSALGLSTATPPLVLNGVNATNWSANYSAFNYTPFQAAAALTDYVTCTPPYAVTAFDIFYIDYQTGTWQYHIDSGSSTVVTTTGVNTAAGSSLKKASITGLTAGTHTLHIDALGVAANVCNICGVAAYSSTTSGVAFANHGWTGMGLYTGQNANNALSDTGKFPVDRRGLYQGYQGTTAAPSQLTGLGFPTQPDLAIVSLGVNDSNQSVTKANYKEALMQLVYTLKYGRADACSVLIVAPYTATGAAASATAVTNQDYTGSTVAAYHDIKSAMLEVAQEYGCAFIDIHQSFGRKAVANGWITSATNIHPNTAGYAKMAKLIGSVL